MSTGVPMGGGVITSRDGLGNPIVTYYAPITPPAVEFHALDYYQELDGQYADPMINRAIAAAAAAGGGIVRLSGGTFQTQATIVLTGDSVTLRGAGWDTIIQPVAGATFDVIATPIPPSSGTPGYVRQYCGIEQLVIDCSQMAGNVAGQGNAIHYYGARFCYVRDVFIHNQPNWAILLDGDSTNFGYNCSIQRVVTDQGNAGIFATGCEACTFIDCIFKYAGASVAAAQPAFTSPDTYANHLRLASGYHYVAGCVFGKSGTYTTEAIRLSNSGPSRIVGNRFDQVRYQAVNCQAAGQIIANNQIGNPSSAGTTFGIQIGSQNNVVSGNRFDTSNGAAHYTYCVGEPSAQANNLIVNNQFVAGTSGFVSLNAASTGDVVAHNLGYNPVGKLGNQPAVPASGTAWTNNSGVDVTIYLTGGTFTGNHQIGGQSIGNSTATVLRIAAGQSVTLTYSAAPTWIVIGD